MSQGQPNFVHPRMPNRGYFSSPRYHNPQSNPRAMHSRGCGRGRGYGYGNYHDNYTNQSHIITNRTLKPYSIPVVTQATAVGTQSLPVAFPSTSAPAGAGESGRGRQSMPSNTPNLPNVPKSGASNFGDTMAAALKQLSELQNSRTVCLS